MNTPAFSSFYLSLFILLFCGYGYYKSRQLAIDTVKGDVKALHSLPKYFGTYTALFIFFPCFLVFFLWKAFQDSVITQMVAARLPASLPALATEQKKGLFLNEVHNMAFSGVPSNSEGAADAAMHFARLYNLSNWTMWIVIIIVGIVAYIVSQKAMAPRFRARNKVEGITKVFLITCASIAILTTIGIVASVLFGALDFFQRVPVQDFLFGTVYAPGPDAHAKYGALPLFAGTALITVIAMLVAVPIGLLSAIYLREYASPAVRAIGKPLLEILAGIPTVVYGFFAALTVGPGIRNFANMLGLEVPSELALSAGLVMGIMIIPFISSLSDDVINAVPQSLRDGSYGLGSTKSETIKRVILPAALPGIVSAILLALSRAIGETMIVVMAAGLAAKLSFSPLDSVTTVTVQIVTALVGDQEFDSAQTLVAYALGFVLFIVTLILNFIALIIVRKYREQYD